MATSNIFAGIVTARANPGVLEITSASAVPDAGTVLAAQLLGGINVSPTAGANAITLCTGALLGAALFGRVSVGDTFDFVNISPDVAGSTVSGAAGMTLVGDGVTANAAVAANGSARFLVRCTAVPTDSAGTGATFSVYRA